MAKPIKAYNATAVKHAIKDLPPQTSTTHVRSKPTRNHLPHNSHPPDNPDSYSDWPLLPLPLILFSISLFLGVIVFVRHSPSLFFLTVALCLVLYWMPTSLRFLFRMLTASAKSVLRLYHPGSLPSLAPSSFRSFSYTCFCTFSVLLFLTAIGVNAALLTTLFLFSLPSLGWYPCSLLLKGFRIVFHFLLPLSLSAISQLVMCNQKAFFQTQLRREYLTSDTSTLVPHLQPQWTRIGSLVGILFLVLAINFSPLLSIALITPLLLSFALAILHDNPAF